MKNLKEALGRVDEGSTTAGIEKELKNLIAGIKDKSLIDKSLHNDTDGELLAMFLNPVLQSVLFSVKDLKGFRKNLKF